MKAQSKLTDPITPLRGAVALLRSCARLALGSSGTMPFNLAANSVSLKAGPAINSSLANEN